MKTIQLDKFGGPEVLHLADAPDPLPGKGEVRVRVRIASINPYDGKVRVGAMETKLPTILGAELAGTVDEVGEGVTLLKKGDEVFGWSTSGAYAELAIAKDVTNKPAHLAWDVAAALPVAGETAHRVLDLLGVGRGEVVLIHGGAGSVGAMAIQLAILRGAKVVATGSAQSQDFMRSLGATPILYGDGLVDRVRALALHSGTDAPMGVHAVFDVAGKGALPASIEIRGGKTRIVTIADRDAQSHGIPFSAGTPKDRSVPLLDQLARYAVDGQIKVKVAASFPLADARKAHELSDGGHAGGKIELVVT